MQKIREIRIVILIGILLITGLLKGQEVELKSGIREGHESEYYYAFTEATRYTIYQYYNQAVGLYKKCLEYNQGSAAIKYQLSRIYYRTGYIGEAKKMGLEARMGEPTNRWYLVNLIGIYQTTNNFDSAILYTNELISLEPQRSDNYLNLSILYQLKREYKKSLKVLEETEKLFGNSIEIYTLRYNIYTSLENKKRAKEQLYLALQNQPENISINGLIAEFYRDNGKRDSAEKYYDYINTNGSDDPVSVFSYIDYLVRFNEKEKALQYVSTVIRGKKISREQISGYFLNKLESGQELQNNRIFYGNALDSVQYYLKDDIRISALIVDFNVKTRQFENAARELRKMMKRNERDLRVWEQLLFVENMLDQSDSLIIHGKMAITLFEENSIPYLYAGIGYIQKKEYREALKILEKGIKYTERSELLLQYFVLMAEAYNGLENREKGFEFYEKALTIDNNNITVLNNYAYFLSLEGKELEKAMKMSEITIKKEKRNAVYLDTYAWIKYKMDKKAEAKYYIKKAMKYGGENDREIKEHYYIIYKKKREQED